MRLVYLHYASLPSRAANTVHVMKMCHAFAQNGNNVTLISLRDKDRLHSKYPLYDFYGVGKSFNVIRVPKPSKKYRKKAISLMSLAARLMIPDVFYSRDIFGCYRAASLGLNVIYESHQPPESLGPKTLDRFLKLSEHPRFRRLIVISEVLKQLYLDLAPRLADRIVVAHDAADLPSCKLTGPAAIEKRAALTIGYVGHLYEGRGIDIIAALAERCRWADFHIVGGMPEGIDHWRTKLADLENVTMHGFVPPAKVSAYLRCFDVVLAPYQRRVFVEGGAETSRWMSPMKIFEYMAHAKPIICSDLPVLREVLEHGRNSLLCDPDDLNAWMAALEQLHSDPALRDRLGRAAEAQVMREHTWVKRASSVLEGLNI